MIVRRLLIVCVVVLTAFGCKTNQKTTSSTSTVLQEAIEEEVITERSVYNPARERAHDLLHTLLRVEFDWKQARLNGEAELTLRPYFYATDKLVLDAKGFDIHEVKLLKKMGTDEVSESALTYSYEDSLKLHIALDKVYTSKDTFMVKVRYTAKPNELEEGGSKAITSDKGLYFINPDSSEADKPTQIWTQGETEASSCWFPTIDAPNERMTQEIYITVDKRFATLSNGLLQFSMDNGNGTRTDYWKQTLPHAPYLAMMGIGDWKIVKDDWKGMEVSYYMEPDWENDARRIFGNTPEMLTFYSDILGVEYPWEKYAQVIVRDYVSGAMENTTAVIHGAFMHTTEREDEDESEQENVIAHELFHHWFGDLVTCESWANLPLNESFATYGEYLWIEYKYGRDAADYHLHNDLRAYFGDAARNKKDLIRFGYDDKEDMFDGHSYQKGGRVLHMLRKYVGDEAFFASLKLYLEKYKYKAVEIHDLRLVFEEVTGKDLNWFFNQWFLDKGHPELEVTYDYIDSNKTVIVNVHQKQNLKLYPLYKIPLEVDIYANHKVERKQVWLDSRKEEFEFKVASKPDLINVDAERMLLGKIDEDKTKEELIFQYYNAPRYLDRYFAISELGDMRNDSNLALVIMDALNDPHWNIRKVAISSLTGAFESDPELVKSKLLKLSKEDPESAVRSEATRFLYKNLEEDKSLETHYESLLEDKSYRVVASGLRALATVNEEKALKKAEELEKEDDSSIKITVADLYVEHGGDDKNLFFIEAINDTKGFYRVFLMQRYSTYLVGKNDETLAKGMELLEDFGRNGNSWYLRFSALNAMKLIISEYEAKEKIIRAEMQDIKGTDDAESKTQAKEEELNQVIGKREAYQKTYDDILSTEENENVLLMLERSGGKG